MGASTPLRLLKAPVLVVMAMAALSGCRRDEPTTGGAKKQQGTRVTILADNLTNPMRNYQAVLLDRLIRTRPHMEVTVMNAADDGARQAQQAREAAGNGADFIMVFPKDVEKLKPALRDALAKGVKIFAFSADIPDEFCTCAIFSDDRRLGGLAGDFIVSALKTKAADEGRTGPSGRVVLLRGDEDSNACKQRAEGFLQAIQKAPGVILVHDAPANWNEKDASARIQEALRLQKQFDVIYAQSDSMALGAGKAVSGFSIEARESMLIIGTDGVPGKGAGVDMVIRGEQDATLYNPPLVDLAWRDMQSMLDSPAHNPKKRRSVKPFLITLENAAKLQQTGIPAPDTE